MLLSVIITTYNSEVWLQKVLEGYCNQTETNFEVVIADDGSTENTKLIIESFSHKFQFPIQHIWQEDNGFQKCKILNKAILKTNSEYLLFTDGDCIPRKDFVAQHLKYQEEGYFLSGGYFKLPMETSNIISLENIKHQHCFSISWLIKNGVSKSFKLSKLTKFKPFAVFMNWLTPTKRTFNGHNTSCFKNDLIAVNGFNEEMQYGGLDREVGERLFNLGILSKQIRYSAICLHLDHKRGYATTETWEKNNAIRSYNKKHNVTFIENGLSKYISE
ncbi:MULTISPECIES: glycosyltransferase family 2 protein [unclassified Flavobacterium]|uniref:glycosyltransferase family 2 protein n=1 Tax=unclassified Flavobacterium TaxID=196869 RepID=UPI0012908E48|nr:MULTISPECIES: glycosyltransferase family 2 protein [unclassified Flavobacterium]MQP52920.1 glycosyltransferase [Flavobacterium sp. LMO9]MQP63191.1 glycosyltransferase [Flavobacterium sp. LMO6]